MNDDQTPRLDDLSAAILRELAAAPGPAGMSLPRLAKHLGLGASVVMRALSALGHARIGGVDGPGWVRVVQEEDRWTATLTEAGRRVVDGQPPAAPGTDSPTNHPGTHK